MAGGIGINYCDGDPQGNCKAENFFSIDRFSNPEASYVFVIGTSAMMWTGTSWAGTARDEILHDGVGGVYPNFHRGLDSNLYSPIHLCIGLNLVLKSHFFLVS